MIKRAAIMKAAGIVVFAVKMLEALYDGYTNADNKRVVNLKESVMPKANRRRYVGMGIVLIGGALLLFGRKKPLND